MTILGEGNNFVDRTSLHHELTGPIGGINNLAINESQAPQLIGYVVCE